MGLHAGRLQRRHDTETAMRAHGQVAAVCQVTRDCQPDDTAARLASLISSARKYIDSVYGLDIRHHVRYHDGMLNNNSANLIVAARSGHIAGIRATLAAADLHAESEAALRHAAANGDAAAVNLLLMAGADIHAVNDLALCNAAFNGHVEVIKNRLTAGVNIHAFRDDALLLAVLANQLDAVRCLMAAGANVNADHDAALRCAAIMIRRSVSSWLPAPGPTQRPH